MYIFSYYTATIGLGFTRAIIRTIRFISVLVGAGAAWFGLYAGTHKAQQWSRWTEKIVLDNRLKFIVIYIMENTIDKKTAKCGTQIQSPSRLGIGTTARFVARW